MAEGMESVGDLSGKLAHYNQQLEERLGVNSVDASEKQEREQAPSKSRAWSPRRFRLPFRAATSRSKSPSRRVKEPFKDRPENSSRQLKEPVQERSSSPSRLSPTRRTQQETTRGQSTSPSRPVKETARTRPESPSPRGRRPAQGHSKSPSRRQSPPRGDSPRRRVTDEGGDRSKSPPKSPSRRDSRRERSKSPPKSPSRRHARGERSKSPTKDPSRRARDREKARSKSPTKSQSRRARDPKRARSKSPTKSNSRRESEPPLPFSIKIVAVPADEGLDDDTSYGHHAASVRASVVARQETQSIDQLPTCREEMSLEQHSSRHMQDQRSSSPCRSSSPSRQYTPDARFKETVDSLYSDLLQLSVQEQVHSTPPELNLLDQDNQDYHISFSPPPSVIPTTTPREQRDHEISTSRGGARYQATTSPPVAMDQGMRVASMKSIDDLIDIMEKEENTTRQAAAATEPAPCDATRASDPAKSEKSWTNSLIGDWDPEKDIRLFYEKYHKLGFVPKKEAAKVEATKQPSGFFEALGRYIDNVQHKVCSDVSTACSQEPPVALRRHGPAN